MGVLTLYVYDKFSHFTFVQLDFYMVTSNEGEPREATNVLYSLSAA
jgi:hypothetical protein